MSRILRAFFMFVVVTVPAVFCLSACSGNNAENERLKTLIRQYDSNLGEAFAKESLKVFGDTLTASHFNRLDHRLTGMKKAGRKMESRVRQIDFIEFADLGDKELGFPRVRVRTREVWDVRHLDAASGQVIKNVDGLVYDLAYEFEKHDGVWQIDSVEVRQQTISAR